VEDVLLVPNRAVRLVEGERVVYILRDGQAERVVITLGATSDLVSEVASGDLREGDVIILNPPADFTQDGPPFMR
jgi:HlyD family secretion protein